MSTDPDKLQQLREPFPAASIGKLPKGNVLLDYVGHAAVTNRLLNVDPKWTWEPLALDENLLPAMDKAGNLWIRLTVLGVTRIGVGDGKNMKERIGDAIRNAAMRFGVALDLWAKEELEHDRAEWPSGQEPIPDPVTGEVPMEDGEAQVRMMGKGQMIQLKTLEKTLGMDGEEDRERRLAFYAWMTGRVVNSSKELTQDEADLIIDELRSRERSQAQT